MRFHLRVASLTLLTLALGVPLAGYGAPDPRPANAELDDVALVYEVWDSLERLSATLQTVPDPVDRVELANTVLDGWLASILPPATDEPDEEPPPLPRDRAAILSAAIPTLAATILQADNLSPDTAAYLGFYDRLTLQRLDEGNPERFPAGELEAYLWYVEGQRQSLAARACGADAGCLVDRLEQSTRGFEFAAKVAVTSDARRVALHGAAQAYGDYFNAGSALDAQQLLAARQNAARCALEAAAYDDGEGDLARRAAEELHRLASQALTAGHNELAADAGHWTWSMAHGGLDLLGLPGGATPEDRAVPRTGQTAALLPGPVTVDRWRDLTGRSAERFRDPVVSATYVDAPITYRHAAVAAHTLLASDATPTCKDACPCITLASHLRDSVEDQLESGALDPHLDPIRNLFPAVLADGVNLCGMSCPQAFTLRDELTDLHTRLAARTPQTPRSGTTPTLEETLRAELAGQDPEDAIDHAETLITGLRDGLLLSTSRTQDRRARSAGNPGFEGDVAVLVPALAVLVADRMWLTAQRAKDVDEVRARKVVRQAVTLAASILAVQGSPAAETVAHLLERGSELTRSSLEVDGVLLDRLQRTLGTRDSGGPAAGQSTLGGLAVVFGAPSELRRWIESQDATCQDWGMRPADEPATPSRRAMAAVASVAFRESLLLAANDTKVSLWGRGRTGALTVDLPPVYGAQDLRHGGANPTLEIEIPAVGQRVVVALDSTRSLRLAGAPAPGSRGANESTRLAETGR